MNVRSYHYTIADSWLYSAICHLAILLVLLSVTAPIVHRRPPRQLIVTMGEHSGEELSVLHAPAPSLPPADQAIDLAAAIDLRPPPVASPAAVAIPPDRLLPSEACLAIPTVVRAEGAEPLSSGPLRQAIGSSISSMRHEVCVTVAASAWHRSNCRIPLIS